MFSCIMLKFKIHPSRFDGADFRGNSKRGVAIAIAIYNFCFRYDYYFEKKQPRNNGNKDMVLYRIDKFKNTIEYKLIPGQMF